ncbi:MAG: hypothetical protein QGG36_28175 [Pirellulaceae bacterium]|nr:hypothetical protein [Pirellulaceae bacterium]MDP7019707.1 hypothetical protein [Pirellulaceae bacterium]
MTILRVGTNEKYAAGWDEIFSKKTRKTAKKKSAAKATAKSTKKKKSKK